MDARQPDALSPARLIAPGRSSAPTPSWPGPRPSVSSHHHDHPIGGSRRHSASQRRAATVEPVNGHLKDHTALRRFARRGLTACQAALTLAAMVLNLGKFCRLASPQRTAALSG
ncbi:transposase [[Actinomadura] parvosata]|uniref:transposase n=1 Tax=[Actinomadura] parvosata TaxID=1955412 RepID=UPI00406D2629